MENTNIDSVNQPTSTATAQELWEKDKKEFALWALCLVGAKPIVHDDRVDGILGFVESGNKKQKIFVQVKGINITPRMIKDLLKTIEKDCERVDGFGKMPDPDYKKFYERVKGLMSLVEENINRGDYPKKGNMSA